MSDKIIFEKLDEFARIPKHQSEGAAGMDLHSVEEKIILAGQTKMVDIGLKMKIPYGYEAQIRSRSGLAAKHGVMVSNSPATIDSDYRGPLKVILYNSGLEEFHIHKGDRIAQMVIAKVEYLDVIEGKVENDTERGEGGFGSTGKK